MGSRTLFPQIDTTLPDPRSDGRLLEQFAKNHDHEAFAVLLQRHGPYLFAVCRRLTTHLQDAEDIYQACFMELVKNSRSISQPNSIAGWLQTVAVRLAHKARARRGRQRRNEAKTLKMEAAIPEDVSWREVCRILDEETTRLPDELRSAVILCLFEGRSRDEAAQMLDLNPLTVKGRLARGRKLLRQRLMHRGVTLAAMGAVLSSSAEAAVSAALNEITMHGVVAVVNQTALSAIVSPSLNSLIAPTSSLTGWGAIALGVAIICAAASAGYAIVQRMGAAPAQQVTMRSNGQRMTQSFGRGDFNRDFFQWSGPSPENFATFEPEGLRIRIPADRGPSQPVGISLRHPVHGDFELQATFEFLQVDRPPGVWGAGVTVYFFMEDEAWNGLWFGKMNTQKRGPAIVIGRRVGKQKDRVDNFADAIAVAEETGRVRLRVVRRGHLFSFFVGEGAAGELRHIHTLEISSHDVQVVRFAADPGPRRGVAMDVRLLDFEITADDFVGYDL